MKKLKSQRLFYLASPYSHNDREVMTQRAEQVLKATVDLLKEGYYMFSPIAYNVPMEKFNLPTDWNFWQDYDKAFVKRCDALAVLQIEGWRVSVGVAAEVEYAKSLGIPIFYITPEQIETGDLEHLCGSGVKYSKEYKLFDDFEKL
jgi:nucleoside 2-deoxyribosyltransferase